MIILKILRTPKTGVPNRVNHSSFWLYLFMLYNLMVTKLHEEMKMIWHPLWYSGWNMNALSIFSNLLPLWWRFGLLMTHSICQDLFPVSYFAASHWPPVRRELWLVENVRGRRLLAAAGAWRPESVIWWPEPRTPHIFPMVRVSYWD